MKKFCFFIFCISFLSLYANDNIAASNKKDDPMADCPSPVWILDDSDLFRRNEKAVFTNVEFLYWTADSGCDQYAFQYDSAISTAGTYYGLGKYKTSEFDWDLGFRLGIGWFNAPGTYDVVGEYTWVKIKNTQSVKYSATSPIAAVFPYNGVFSTSTLDKAKSTIELNHQILDTYVARVWFPNLHCRLRLLGGLTGALVEKENNIKYTDSSSDNEYVNNKWKYLAVGFRMGINVDWYWCRHIYLCGKITFAPFVGKYKYTGRINADTKGNEIESFKDYHNRGAFHVQAYLGPAYQKAFTNNRVEAFLGYEINDWINLNQVIRNSSVTNTTYTNTEITPAINNSMLVLQGLTARLTLDF